MSKADLLVRFAALRLPRRHEVQHLRARLGRPSAIRAVGVTVGVGASEREGHGTAALEIGTDEIEVEVPRRVWRKGAAPTSCRRAERVRPPGPPSASHPPPSIAPSARHRRYRRHRPNAPRHDHDGALHQRLLHAPASRRPRHPGARHGGSGPTPDASPRPPPSASSADRSPSPSPIRPSASASTAGSASSPTGVPGYASPRRRLREHGERPPAPCRRRRSPLPPRHDPRASSAPDAWEAGIGRDIGREGPRRRPGGAGTPRSSAEGDPSVGERGVRGEASGRIGAGLGGRGGPRSRRSGWSWRCRRRPSTWSDRSAG